MKKLLFRSAMLFLVTLFLCSCSELDLLRIDEGVQDVNTIAQGTQAVMDSPAGLLIPPTWKLYGALGVIIANGLIIGWQEWRNRTMKKTAKAIVIGIERSNDKTIENSVGANTITTFKANIAKAMLEQGGEKFYGRANKIVDRLKIS